MRTETLVKVLWIWLIQERLRDIQQWTSSQTKALFLHENTGWGAVKVCAEVLSYKKVLCYWVRPLLYHLSTMNLVFYADFIQEGRLRKESNLAKITYWVQIWTKSAWILNYCRQLLNSFLRGHYDTLISLRVVKLETHIHK